MNEENLTLLSINKGTGQPGKKKNSKNRQIEKGWERKEKPLNLEFIPDPLVAATTSLETLHKFLNLDGMHLSYQKITQQYLSIVTVRIK